jgi:selT/selW/selH-like putative selenoprotein
MILRAVPEAKVTGNVGRRSSFEVTINGKLIFSKLTAGGFPKFENVVDEVVKAKKGLAADQVTETQPSSCNLI